MKNQEDSCELLFRKNYEDEFLSEPNRKAYEDEAQTELFFLAHSERLSKYVSGDKKSNLLFFMNAANAVACKIHAYVDFLLDEEENKLIATIAFENNHFAVIEDLALKHFITMSNTATSIEFDFFDPNIFITGTFCFE